MALTTIAFLVLLAAVGASRLIELRISRRHQRTLESLGVRAVDDPSFPVMVALHSGILVGAAIEVIALKRSAIPALALSMVTVFAGAEALRWWVIRTLGLHWNVQVMNSVGLGVVSSGPFRFVRHPNYAAVFVEMIALPLVHTAWLTALVGTAAHMWVLSGRVAVEEKMLLADPLYQMTMGHKPRFLPILRGTTRDASIGDR
jgi:methyltransferase